MEIGYSWKYGFVLLYLILILCLENHCIYAAGGIAGLVGNPGGAFVTLIARVIVSNFEILVLQRL